MKKFAAIVGLSLVAFGAQAQDYFLVNYTATVPFGTASPSDGFAGSATVSGSNVTVNSVSWGESVNANAAVQYSGSWTTTLGTGVDILKTSETCVQTPPSTVCGTGKAWTNRNGLLGNWINGQDASGAADARYSNSAVVSGNQLIITRVAQFIDDPGSFFFGLDCPGGCNTNVWTYQVVPVPAAVWLFGSALGLMAWLRRRGAVAA